VLECVPNVSEGRDTRVCNELAAACGASLLDVHRDPDHHRSVFTLAGPGARDAEDAARRLAYAVADRLDLGAHDGVHPRIGALDVVPFVALDGTDSAVAVEAACTFAAWVTAELGVPALLYGDADPAGRSLPTVRAAAAGLEDTFHSRLGAVAVGARPVLVAVNCELDRDDVVVARAVAREVRERDGGLPGVRALGFALPSRGGAQVSMNLVDLRATGLQAAYERVREAARDRGADVARVELVGLLPRAERERCDAAFLDWAGIGDDRTIEARLGARAVAWTEPGRC
jgi:glutamate formiminotransferase